MEHNVGYDTIVRMGADFLDQFRAVVDAARQQSAMLESYRAVAKQLHVSLAMGEAVEAARQQSAMLESYRAAAKQLHVSSAMGEAVEAARQQSAMLESYRAAAKQLHVSSAMSEAVEAARQQSAMLESYRVAAKQLHVSSAMSEAVEAARQQSAMLESYRALAKQLHVSSAMGEAVEAARQQSAMLESYRALAKQVQVSPAMRQVAEMAKQLQQSSELFGDAWDERLAEAVGRLERAEDIIQNTPEPEQAAKELVEDATTVQEAAPSGAQQSVNTLVHHVAMAFLIELLAGPGLEAAGEAVREAVFSLIMALLIATVSPTALPDLPPAPRLLTSIDIEPVATAGTLPGDWAVGGLPAVVERAGPVAAERVVEFFAAQISNPNTRAAYANAVTRFFAWCDERGLELDQISPVAVGIYVEEMQRVYRAPTIKQHLAAIRRLFDWLVVGQVVPWNPTAAVRGPAHIVRSGKTPVLQSAEVRLLLDSIDTSAVAGLRDRALLGVMLYTFARVSAVCNMDVDDYYQQGNRWWLRFREKGGKYHTVPAHHKAEAYLDAYVEAAGIAAEKGTPLWRSLARSRELGERRMSRVDVFRMIKRRVRGAALGETANCHTFRASGITAYLLNGGLLERAQAIAGHESPRTTQLYDRTADEVTVEDVERIKV